MAIITYNFIPNQDIWVITDCGIKTARVIQVRATEKVSVSELKYDVHLIADSTTVELEEADMFADKATALAAYDIRLG